MDTNKSIIYGVVSLYVLFANIKTVPSSCDWDCSWETWGNWSPCSVLCGGGTRRRLKYERCCESYYRQAYGPCEHACIKNHNEEVDTCNQKCYNGGFYTAGSCNCKATNYGTCCEMCELSSFLLNFNISYFYIITCVYVSL